MPIDSHYKPISVPTQDLYNLIFERKDRPFPDDHVVLIDANTKRELSFGQIRDQSKRFGLGLKGLWEWKRGDVLGLFSSNQIDTAPVVLGALWASATVTPANPTYTVDELTFQLKDSGAIALATLAEFLPVAAKAAANAGIPKDRIILIGDTRVEGYYHWTQIHDPTTFKYRKGKFDVHKNLSFLVYSSGTTGHPKGVMLSHSNVASDILMLMVGEGGNLHWSRDSTVAFLPFFHIYGLVCLLLHNIYAGHRAIVMDRFDLEKFCSLTQEFKCTFGYVVPPVILLLAKHPVVAKYDLTSLRMLNSGAAPLTKELVHAVYERLKIPVKQGYGLSETSPVTHTQKWDKWQSTIGSVGQLLPNMTCKYVDEEGKEVAPGGTGELWLKGPNTMIGYLNNPAATANAFSSDGYFKTGDVGHEDAEGNVYITDRVKELIKYKGFQVPPAELEGKLMSHDKIDDVAVIGVYDATLASEVPRAYVVPKPGVNRDGLADEIVEFVHKSMAQHKRLRGGVRFVDVIPRSISGKILRRVLREEAIKEAKAAGGVRAKL